MESIVARSTTYNVTSRGKVAQSVVVVSDEDSAGIDELPLLLMPISKEDQTRTNVGITETAGKPGVVKIRIGSGFFPGESIEIPILPFSHRQVPLTIGNRFFSQSASVEVIGGEARVVAYASIIENLSGDPMYVAGKRDSASRQVIPIAAHFSGPEWASEMWYAYVKPLPDIFFPLQLLPLPLPQIPRPGAHVLSLERARAPLTSGPGKVSSYYRIAPCPSFFHLRSIRADSVHASSRRVHRHAAVDAGGTVDLRARHRGKLIVPCRRGGHRDGESVDASARPMSHDRRPMSVPRGTGYRARTGHVHSADGRRSARRK